MYSHEDLVNNQRFMYTYDLTGRLVRQSVLNGSKKRIYDAEYGYDMNNNVSKLISSAGGVSFDRKIRLRQGQSCIEVYLCQENYVAVKISIAKQTAFVPMFLFCLNIFHQHFIISVVIKWDGGY